MAPNISKTEKGIAITGKLVFANIAALSEQSNQMFVDQKQHNDFEIDCSEIERIDSAGIALLLHWHREKNRNNKTCRFVGLRDQTKSLLKAYRLESVITP